MKILVCDYDPVSRLMLTRWLCAWGHQVILADHGAQAWDLLQREEPPTVTVLDSVMPVVNGIEICRKLRDLPEAEKRYLLLIGSGDEFDPEVAFDHGADDYIARPFDERTIKARLKIAFRTLELRQRCRALELAKPETDRDPLTGIWNRAALLELLRGHFARSTRDGISLAVILCDMDNFDSLDNNFGHPASSEVIQQAVRRMAAAIRPYDLIGRYSHEEFLIVAPDCTMSNGFGLAERLRTLIADEPFDLGDKEIRASASFGVATTAETGALDEDGLLRSADSALYLAKERGRNRVEMARRIPRQRTSQPRFSTSYRAKEMVQ
jgi:diguanylate cyclase (GGDEF)-like protein